MNKARKFKRNPLGLTSHLNKLICKGYCHNIVVRSLQIVFFGTDIDMLVNSIIRN